MKMETEEMNLPGNVNAFIRKINKQNSTKHHGHICPFTQTRSVCQFLFCQKISCRHIVHWNLLKFLQRSDVNHSSFDAVCKLKKKKHPQTVYDLGSDPPLAT